jgi:hypothetical protein
MGSSGAMPKLAAQYGGRENRGTAWGMAGAGMDNGLSEKGFRKTGT